MEWLWKWLQFKEYSQTTSFSKSTQHQSMTSSRLRIWKFLLEWWLSVRERQAQGRAELPMGSTGSGMLGQLRNLCFCHILWGNDQGQKSSQLLVLYGAVLCSRRHGLVCSNFQRRPRDCLFTLGSTMIEWELQWYWLCSLFRTSWAGTNMCSLWKSRWG